MSLLVVAVIGHRHRGDDAAGPLVGDALRGCGEGIRVVEMGPNPLGLLDSWGPDDDVILVDAVRSGAAPGTVHHFAADAPDLVPEPPRSSTHGFGLATVLQLARVIGNVPAHLEIVGIEGESFAVGGPVHPAVRRAATDVAAAIARQHDVPVMAAGGPVGAGPRAG
jgi:hydrogenase maturation protease